jgi:hypothetical protein
MKLSPEFKKASVPTTGKAGIRSAASPRTPAPVTSALGGFDFGVSLRTGLVPMTAVRLLLGKSLLAANAMIEEGHLRWVFDIRCTRAGRREIRVLRQSLLECAGLSVIPVQDNRPSGEDEDFQYNVAAVFPKGFKLTPQSASAGTHTLNRHATAPADESTGIRISTLPNAAALDMRKNMFPDEPVLRGTDVARFFACSGEHIAKLIAEGLIDTANFRRGPTVTPLVFRASVLKFLKERRVL